ncbi:MAG: type II toxin-antitoxin system HicB family antitoxin [Chloroflexia bacterium]|nr:type II toxin-antitoxin system HicB family antitoxin [Chloroflexia bacterium]
MHPGRLRGEQAEIRGLNACRLRLRGACSRALSGCLTYGESIEDALGNAREAITGYVETLIADGQSIPAETHPTIATMVVVTAGAARYPNPWQAFGFCWG